MLIVGCDFHTRFQQIAMLNPTTGEVIERRLEHENGEAEAFNRTLPGPARVGVEATINGQWFERMLHRYHHELWIGDAAEIRAARVRKQKTDSRDALHILDLLVSNRFPRIWVPAPAERDVRQLVRHRHKLVRFRTSAMNQLHALAIGQGLCRKQKLWSKVGRTELESLVLEPWASRRRHELLKLLDQLNPWIADLDRAVMQEVQSRPDHERAGSGAGHGVGVRVDDRSGQPFRQEQAVGELLGPESQRRKQWGKATAGFDQQAREPDVASLTGRGGPGSLESRSGIAAALPATEIPPWS